MDFVDQAGGDLVAARESAEKAEPPVGSEFVQPFGKSVESWGSIDGRVEFRTRALEITENAEVVSQGFAPFEFPPVVFHQESLRPKRPCSYGQQQAKGAAAVDQERHSPTEFDLIQSVQRTTERFGKTSQRSGQVGRDRDKAGGWRCNQFGKAAVPMEAEDAHVPAEVFQTGTARGTFTAGLSRPDHVTFTTHLAAGADFVAEDSWQHQVPLPLLPHLGIGSADRAMG